LNYQFQIDFGQGFIDVPQPLNHAAIKIELAFTSQTPSASIQNIAFEWLGETAKKINAYVAGGNSGKSNGIYEGLPLKVLVCNTSLGFDMILDLTAQAATFECDRVVCPFKQVGGVDWFSTLSAGFSFWYLAGALTDPANGYKGPGQITIADFKKTPYVISTIPNYTQTITLSISLLAVIWQTKDTIKKLAQAIDKLAGDIGSLIGYNVAAPGKIGDIVADVIIIVAELVYLIILLNTFLTLFDDIGKNLIQAKKYKYCMRTQDLFRKACEYMGLQFSSTIYAVGSPFENETWMPKKIVMPQFQTNFFDITQNQLFSRPADENGNSNAYGYYDGSVQQFIQDMCTIHNASIVIINGVCHFEEVHFWNKQNPYKIPNTSELGYVVQSPDPHGTNATECPGALLVEFQTDTTDLNTVNYYAGTSCQIIVAPKKVGNIQHLLTPPGQTIIFPCALGKRKNYLTSFESALNNFISNVDQFLQCFILKGILTEFQDILTVASDAANHRPPTQDQFNTTYNILHGLGINSLDDRFGWLLLSDDTFSVPKLFIGYDEGGDWKVKDDPNNPQIATAINYTNHFQGKNLATRGNQYLTYNNKTFPFCCEDFLQVLNNNILLTPTGEYGKITKLIWNLEDEKAEQVDYRINTNFTNNLTETVIVDGVQQP